MFKDVFNFSKPRSLKESVGFFIVHTAIILGVYALLSAMGVA